jgi:predicted DsbA family dithiol-disulfide isomerase
MHELLLDHQGALEMNDLNEYAESVGLDPDQFSDDLRQRRFAKRIAADVDSADSSQVTGTPSFFINGLRHEGAYDIETMSDMVRGIIKAQRRSA